MKVGEKLLGLRVVKAGEDNFHYSHIGNLLLTGDGSRIWSFPGLSVTYRKSQRNTVSDTYICTLPISYKNHIRDRKLFSFLAQFYCIGFMSTSIC